MQGVAQNCRQQQSHKNHRHQTNIFMGIYYKSDGWIYFIHLCSTYKAPTVVVSGSSTTSYIGVQNAQVSRLKNPRILHKIKALNLGKSIG